MIKHKELWLYGFWRRNESENEYIIYGVNKNILLSGILIQTLLLATFLVLLFIFENMWFLSTVLIISTSLFINRMQKTIYWFNFNSDSKKLLLLSKGFRTPEAIEGRFTIGKKRFMRESGFVRDGEHIAE